MKFRDHGILEKNKEIAKTENPVFMSQEACSGKVLMCNKFNRFVSRKGFYKHRKGCQKDDVYFPAPTPMSSTMLSEQAEDDPNFRSLLDGLLEDEPGSLCR